MPDRRLLIRRQPQRQPQPPAIRHPHKSPARFHQLPDLLPRQLHPLHIHQHLQVKPVQISSLRHLEPHRRLHRIRTQGLQTRIQLHTRLRRQPLQPLHKPHRKILRQPHPERPAPSLPRQPQFLQQRRNRKQRPPVKPRHPPVPRRLALHRPPRVPLQYLTAQSLIIPGTALRTNHLRIRRRPAPRQPHRQPRPHHHLHHPLPQRRRQINP